MCNKGLEPGHHDISKGTSVSSSFRKYNLSLLLRLSANMWEPTMTPSGGKLVTLRTSAHSVCVLGQEQKSSVHEGGLW